MVVFMRRPQLGHGPGRGLGLAMVRDITLRHGGTIDLDTEPHTGTCFTLTFTKERS